MSRDEFELFAGMRPALLVPTSFKLRGNIRVKSLLRAFIAISLGVGLSLPRGANAMTTDGWNSSSPRDRTIWLRGYADGASLGYFKTNRALSDCISALDGSTIYQAVLGVMNDAIQVATPEQTPIIPHLAFAMAVGKLCKASLDPGQIRPKDVGQIRPKESAQIQPRESAQSQPRESGQTQTPGGGVTVHRPQSSY
jgi:hypothetical protein